MIFWFLHIFYSILKKFQGGILWIPQTVVDPEWHFWWDARRRRAEIFDFTPKYCIKLMILAIISRKTQENIMFLRNHTKILQILQIFVCNILFITDFKKRQKILQICKICSEILQYGNHASHMQNRCYKSYCHFGTTGPNRTIRRWDESVSSYEHSRLNFVAKSSR